MTMEEENEQMSETENAPRLDTGTDVDHEAAARVAAQLEQRQPPTRQRTTAEIMHRPAPVPSGFIAVELPDAPFWFLVRLDFLCETCRGAGRLPDAGEGALGPENCCPCVLQAVQECWNEAAASANEHNAEARVETADKKLEERINKARERVQEIERERDAAVGNCESEQRELEARIPELAAAINFADGLALEHKQRAAAANADVLKRELEAARRRDEAVRDANAAFSAVQSNLLRERQEIAVALLGDLGAVDADKSKAEHDRAAAEERLAFLKAGPEKIRRRFEEKLKGPRATLERLERQWKR